MIEIHSLLIIALVAVLAPLINRLPLRVRVGGQLEMPITADSRAAPRS